MIDIASLFDVVNTIALAGSIGGFVAYGWLHYIRDTPMSLRTAVPLLCCATTLGVIGFGYFFSGPVYAVVARTLIVFWIVISEIALLQPVCLTRRLTSDP